MLAKLLIPVFLLAHAAIHASFIAPRPPVTAGGPPWPFELGRSWILTPLGLDAAAMRLLGIGLLAALVAGYMLAAGAALELSPGGAFAPGVVIGSVSSVGLLIVFFHPWLTLGLGIDVVLLWAVLMAGWLPDGVTL